MSLAMEYSSAGLGIVCRTRIFYGIFGPRQCELLHRARAIFCRSVAQKSRSGGPGKLEQGTCFFAVPPLTHQNPQALSSRRDLPRLSSKICNMLERGSAEEERPERKSTSRQH